MSELNVELYETLIGTLTQRGSGFEFKTHPKALKKHHVSS